MTFHAKPWEPQQLLTESQVSDLLGSAFPELHVRKVAVLAAGWDNTAYLVNDELVFRFPRREIAAKLLEMEAQLLPWLRTRVELPIPAPEYFGRPSETFLWPFAGYRRLPGRSVADASLSHPQRHNLTRPLAQFLRQLHSVPIADPKTLCLPPDNIRRLDIEYRKPLAMANLDRLAGSGLIHDPNPLRDLIDDLSHTDGTCTSHCLVHGDLYSRHLLVDDEAELCGVIDWGDAHWGNPAVDLAVAHMVLPSEEHALFRETYGPIDEGKWRLARFRAIYHLSVCLVYALDIGDDFLRDECLTGLHLAGHSQVHE